MIYHRSIEPTETPWYICLDCGNLFDDTELVDLSDKSVGYTGYACPYCGSQDFEETVYCELCDRVIGKSQARFGLCPYCEEAVDRRFRNLLAQNFTTAELIFLNNQYDGEFFGLWNYERFLDEKKKLQDRGVTGEEYKRAVEDLAKLYQI